MAKNRKNRPASSNGSAGSAGPATNQADGGSASPSSLFAGRGVDQPAAAVAPPSASSAPANPSSSRRSPAAKKLKPSLHAGGQGGLFLDPLPEASSPPASRDAGQLISFPSMHPVAAGSPASALRVNTKQAQQQHTTFSSLASHGLLSPTALAFSQQFGIGPGGSSQARRSSIVPFGFGSASAPAISVSSPASATAADLGRPRPSDSAGPPLPTRKASTWMLVPAVFLALFLDNFITAFVVPILPLYLKDPEKVGFLFASKALVQILCNPFVGVLTDAAGRVIPMQVGNALFVVSNIIFAAARGYMGLLFARALQGVASSLLATAGMALLADVFTDETERGVAMGKGLSGVALGLLSGPPCGGFLYYISGGTVTLPFAAVSALSVVLAFLLFWVHEPARPSAQQPGDLPPAYEEHGRRSVGDASETAPLLWALSSQRDHPSADGHLSEDLFVSDEWGASDSTAAAGRRDAGAPPMPYGTIAGRPAANDSVERPLAESRSAPREQSTYVALLRNGAIAAAFLSLFVANSIVAALEPTLPLWWGSSGIGLTDNPMVVGFLLASSTISYTLVSPFSGVLGARVGRARLICAGLVFLGAALPFIALPRSILGFCPPLLLSGIGIGLVDASCLAVVAAKTDEWSAGADADGAHGDDPDRREQALAVKDTYNAGESAQSYFYHAPRSPVKRRRSLSRPGTAPSSDRGGRRSERSYSRHQDEDQHRHGQHVLARHVESNGRDGGKARHGGGYYAHVFPSAPIGDSLYSPCFLPPDGHHQQPGHHHHRRENPPPRVSPPPAGRRPSSRGESVGASSSDGARGGGRNMYGKAFALADAAINLGYFVGPSLASQLTARFNYPIALYAFSGIGLVAAPVAYALLWNDRRSAAARRTPVPVTARLP